MKLLKWPDYEPKHDNGDFVTESALRRSIVVSAIGILLCMTCLFGVTWAWYTASVVTEPNQISSATYDLDITVTEQGQSNPVPEGTDDCYILQPEKEYKVQLTKSGTAQTGFCQLAVLKQGAEADTAYYTENIIDTNNPFVFTISGATKIKFVLKWGKCPVESTSEYYVHNNGKLSLQTQQTNDEGAQGQ